MKDNGPTYSPFTAIIGAGASPLFIAIPVMAFTGGAPLWFVIVATLVSAFVLGWTVRVIRSVVVAARG